jgi:hypothetical protein
MYVLHSQGEEIVSNEDKSINVWFFLYNKFMWLSSINLKRKDTFFFQNGSQNPQTLQQNDTHKGQTPHLTSGKLLVTNKIYVSFIHPYLL